MVKFSFEGHDVSLPDWSKHHKWVGLHVKRIYKDGKEVLPEDEQLQEIIKNHTDKLQEHTVSIMPKGSLELEQAKDYYLPVYNEDYQEANLEYYNVGAMNTRQTTHMRLTFKLEHDMFILDYNYKSEGSFATSFVDMLSSDHAVEDIIEEILDEEKPLEEVGIEKSSEDDHENYRIVIVTSYGEITDIEISKHELVQSLVGIEVYKFDQEID